MFNWTHMIQIGGKCEASSTIFFPTFMGLQYLHFALTTPTEKEVFFAYCTCHPPVALRFSVVSFTIWGQKGQIAFGACAKRRLTLITVFHFVLW